LLLIAGMCGIWKSSGNDESADRRRQVRRRKDNTMTVGKLLSRFSIGRNQVVKIMDYTKYRTWQSEKGCFAFENYEESAQEVSEYVLGLKVERFECNDDRILIWTE